jgi:DNA-binding CsgD family transcriptional regulator
MQPDDIREAAEIIAKHPVIGPRYGSVIADLPAAWLRLLDSEAADAWVFHAEEDGYAPICMVGVGVIVNDDFVRELKTPPHFWPGPELTKRILRGESPLLSEKQIRDANSNGGLNHIVWEGCALREFESNPELYRCSMDAFIQVHRGYLWKEVIAQPMESVERLHWTMKTGGLLWDAAADHYVDSLIGDADEFVCKPHVVGVRRKELLERPDLSAASWVGCLFDYHPPLLGFNRSEQRVLAAAITGATDEQLSSTLGISVPAIKKTWTSIYHRVADHLPGLVRDAPQSDAGGAPRGREKRRELLAYLRDHPEELRPASRKLLSADHG